MQTDAASTSGPDDPSVDASVYTAYLYYMDARGAGRPRIKAYHFFDGNSPISDREVLAKQLVDNVIAGGKRPRYRGGTFDSIQRERKGFVFIALHGGGFDSADPVTFVCDAAESDASIGNDGRHTFFPCGTFEVQSQQGPVHVAAYLYWAVSYASKKELDHDEWEHYSLQFGRRFVAPFDPIYDDSGGTNMGPPPPPPGRLHGPGAHPKA